MGTTSITIRMDENLKKQAETLFNEMGLNMTTAFTIFTKAAVRQGRIPFEISVDPFYLDANMKTLTCAVRDAEDGKLTPHDLIDSWYGKVMDWQGLGELCILANSWQKVLKRINQLIQDIERNGNDGIGKLEPLKGNLSGWWLRRIDDVNRIVYCINGGKLIIADCRIHYGNSWCSRICGFCGIQKLILISLWKKNKIDCN